MRVYGMKQTYLTFFIGTPHVQFPGFWLIELHGHFGPHAQAYFPTVLKGLSESQLGALK